MRKLSKFAVAIAILLAAGSVFAQTTGTIEGTVLDQDGAPLPGVTIEATSPNLQGSKLAVSDVQGKFRLVLLPPGLYTVNFKLSGFATTEQTGVTVGLGRIVTLQVSMTSAFTEEVVVSGAPPTIDVRSTEIGVNLDSETIKNLPVARNYASVVQIAPGTGQDGACDGCATVYGSSGAENSYYIDGVNTTGVELATQGKVLNFEFIQEVQVKTGGYQAEFGRATGGLINVITKSGGNEFTGDVFGYYDSPDTQQSLAADVKEGATEGGVSSLISEHDKQDFGLDVGGYLIKDKLWFFGAYNYVKDERTWSIIEDFRAYGGDDLGFPYPGDTFTEKVERDLWAAKLTYRLNQANSFILSGFGDPTDNTGPWSVGNLRTLAGEPSQFLEDVEQGGSDWTAKYEGVIGDSLVVDAQAARHREKLIEDGPGFTMPRFYDRTHPIYLEAGIAPSADGFGYTQRARFGRDVYRGNLSYFLENVGGDHEIKAGAEYEDIAIYNESYNSGGQRIYRFQSTDPDTGEPFYYYRHRFYMTNAPDSVYDVDNSWILNPHVVDAKTENLSTYLQDTWRPSSNLTFNVGLRWEQQKMFDNQGNVAAKIDDNWAPRVGFVWDPKGDGTSKVYGSWGRYYETIPADMVIRSFGGEITGFFYNFNGAFDDPDRLNVECDPWINDNLRRCSPLGGENTPVDPNLKGQYIEEAVIGGELQVSKDLAVGAKYIWRDLGRVIEDGLGADLNYFIGNPGEGILQSTFDFGTNAYLFPVSKPKRTFKGVELSARKRFSDNWQMIASYLWSKLEGSYDGTFQASTGQLDPNINSAFDYAEFQVNNSGYLTNDRRHQFKVDGYYAFPFGLNLGLSAYYRTGVPVTAYGYTFAYENWELYLSERGAFGRTDDEWEADLHLGYPIQVGGFEVNLIADVFNLFNRQGETNRNMQYTVIEDYEVINYDTGEVEPPIRPGDTERPPTNPAFNHTNAWQAPRSIRLGVRVTF